MNGYLHLSKEGSPYVIELNTSILPKLTADVVIGAQAKREIGGLLLGTFPRSGGVTLRIEGYLLIEKERSKEARYVLTAEQRAGLSSKRHRLIEGGTEVIGFFRSHIRRDALGLRAEDRKLLEIEFGKALHTALVIRTRAPYTGGFIFPDAEGAAKITRAAQFQAEGLARMAAKVK
ncbi:MAG TPA: hypothetical protein VN633_20230 [Bryobacteraceae bacterium]|nr:hypothetical protein [Bryobacteraceae bacterium]